MASSFKKDRSKTMPLMNAKGVRGGICHAIHRYSKANNKYMKDYDKIKNNLILNIGT